MRKQPELDLPDYVRDRRTGATDILCALGVAVGIVLMLALVGPRGLEPGAIEALIQQQYQPSTTLVSKISSQQPLLIAFCNGPNSA